MRAYQFGKWLFVVCSTLLLHHCAKNVPPPEGSALLPEIDVIQVKENSDEALKLAQEAKLDVEALNSKVILLIFQWPRLRKLKIDWPSLPKNSKP